MSGSNCRRSFTILCWPLLAASIKGDLKVKSESAEELSTVRHVLPSTIMTGEWFLVPYWPLFVVKTIHISCLFQEKLGHFNTVFTDRNGQWGEPLLDHRSNDIDETEVALCLTKTPFWKKYSFLTETMNSYGNHLVLRVNFRPMLQQTCRCGNGGDVRC